MIEVIWRADGIGEVAMGGSVVILSDEQGHVVAMPVEAREEVVAAWGRRHSPHIA